MPENYVSLKHLAEELGMDRSHARRYVLRPGIKPHKRRTPDSQNQLTLAVNQDEADVIREKRREEGFVGASKPVASEFASMAKRSPMGKKLHGARRFAQERQSSRHLGNH